MKSVALYRSEAGRELVMKMYDSALERWPVPYDGLYLDTRHGRTFAIASGEAGLPPLILLHGSCSNAVSWIGDAGEYSRRFRLFAVDLPGEPGRSGAERPSWSDLSFAEWMEDLLEGLGLERAALLGISQGAWTALRFATCHPERVSKLVLLSPGGICNVRPSFLARAISLSMCGRRGAEALNRYVIGGQPLPEEAVRFMDAILTHFRARIGPQPLFTDAELLRLTMPVLGLIGRMDVLFPAEAVAARIHRLLANPTVLILPGAGHVLHNVAKTVMPFLAPDEALAAEACP